MAVGLAQSRGGGLFHHCHLIIYHHSILDALFFFILPSAPLDRRQLLCGWVEDQVITVTQAGGCLMSNHIGEFSVTTKWRAQFRSVCSCGISDLVFWPWYRTTNWILSNEKTAAKLCSQRDKCKQRIQVKCCCVLYHLNPYPTEISSSHLMTLVRLSSRLALTLPYCHEEVNPPVTYDMFHLYIRSPVLAGSLSLAVAEFWQQMGEVERINKWEHDLTCSWQISAASPFRCQPTYTKINNWGENIQCLKFRRIGSMRMHKRLKHLQNHSVSEMIVSTWATIQIFLLFFKTRCWEFELHHLRICIIVFKPWHPLLLHLPCPLPLIKQECPDCLVAWGLLLPLVVWIQ